MIANIEQHFKTITVDGEELYFPDDVGWQIIREDHKFLGKPLAVEWLLWSMVEISSNYPSLNVALGKVGKAFDDWQGYTIAQIDAMRVRVHLVDVKCHTCGWSGIGGTTAEPDLFLSLGQDFQIRYVAAQEIPACSCPNCHQRMPDHIVWCAERIRQ